MSADDIIRIIETIGGDILLVLAFIFIMLFSLGAFDKD